MSYTIGMFKIFILGCSSFCNVFGKDILMHLLGDVATFLSMVLVCVEIFLHSSHILLNLYEGNLMPCLHLCNF